MLSTHCQLIKNKKKSVMLVNRYINFIANAFLHNPFPYIAHGASKHNARTQQHRTRIPSPLPHHLPEQHVLAFPVAWEVGGGAE